MIYTNDSGRFLLFIQELFCFSFRKICTIIMNMNDDGILIMNVIDFLQGKIVFIGNKKRT